MKPEEINHAFWLADQISNYLNASLTAGQISELFAWVEKSQENRLLFEEMMNEQQLIAEHAKFARFDKAKALQKVLPRLDKRPSLLKIYKDWRYAVSAACLFIALGIVIIFLNSEQDINEKYKSFAKNDIAPGNRSATLTLANGRRINLTAATKGELLQDAGLKITKTSSGQIVYEIAEDKTVSDKTAYHTLSTSRGQTYKVVLPDQSVVWLNAASSLMYPTSFARLKERRVFLEGEGYFEVKHNRQPFFVKTNTQTIEDLGTSFNVNAYTDEPDVKTTLVEGSVKINGSVLLKPSEQGLNKEGSITVRGADVNQITAWKNGDFIFKNDDFKSIMRQLSRWYNVEIVYDDSAPDNVELGGYMSRSKNISSILKIMEITGKVHFKLEGRRVIVSR
ncbi:FecR family protein [Pedobacter sp. MC2016-14]|uniref:FecR family protein n=1 Tax=Pedobacter sp. MC2016-14 TaxID=2897327 RepID=UPI001E5A316C|nr:FecR family protein [Pedobacter sp. MC2016-14]MCD0490425.1 FecR family protein [Pedobacter sp. MC2016-14]